MPQADSNGRSNQRHRTRKDLLAAAARRAHPKARFYEDYRRMMDQNDMDAVLIATLETGVPVVAFDADCVDGKLARCTGASSKWGNVFDHGIDLVHPPFWWWAWLHGLEAYGRPLEPIYSTMLLWAIVGGYVAQRLVEGIFMRRNGGMHIHVWRPIDSQFRLVTARRNPNMVLLVASLIAALPVRGYAGQGLKRALDLTVALVALVLLSPLLLAVFWLVERAGPRVVLVPAALAAAAPSTMSLIGGTPGRPLRSQLRSPKRASRPTTQLPSGETDGLP